MRRAFNYLLGISIGALVGASLAILLAPESGEDLREELETRFGRFRDEIQEAAKQRRAELEAQLQNLRQPQEGSSLEE